jgi:dUTPase
VFTRWQIALPTEGVEANDGLDLSALSAIEIEFGARAYPKTGFA